MENYYKLEPLRKKARKILLEFTRLQNVSDHIDRDELLRQLRERRDLLEELTLETDDLMWDVDSE